MWIGRSTLLHRRDGALGRGNVGPAVGTVGGDPAPDPVTVTSSINDENLVNDNLVLVRFCPDHIAAEVLAGLLRSESVPAVVRNLGPIPGLEGGAQVLVPASWLPRSQRLLAQQEPSEDELAELATQTLPNRRE